MTQDIYSRIDVLSPRLSKMANIYATSAHQTPDDLYQSMVLHLIERQAIDPTFCQQNDSYILDAGRKRVCFPAIRRAGVESKYTCGEPEPVDGDDEDYYFDTIAAPGVNPERAVENLEQAAEIAKVIRKGLSGREGEVLSLVVAGVSTSEIASQFGITPAAVSVYKRRIANKVQAVA